MYEMNETLAYIKENAYQLAIFGTIANLLAYVQCAYGAWVGFKDKSHAVPLFAVMTFFAHDSFYVISYLFDLNPSNHPWFEGNFVAMSIFVCLELIMAWQIITYSRKEVGLGETWWQAFFAYLAIQAGIYVMVLWFKSMLGDPLYLEMFAISVVMANIFNIPMLMRRGNRKGQRLVIAWALLFQTGPIYYFFVNPQFGPYFNTPIWQAAGIANTILAAAYLFMLYRAPAFKRTAA